MPERKMPGRKMWPRQKPYSHLLRVCGPGGPENSTDMREMNRRKGHRFISFKFHVTWGALLRKPEKTQSIRDRKNELELL